MIDDVSGDDLSDDDQIAHFGLFADYNPLTFQEVIKETKCQKSMNEGDKINGKE